MKVYYIDRDKCIDITPKIDDKTLIRFLITSGLIVKVVNNPVQLFAYTNEISSGVKPIVDMLIDVAEPVSYGFMVKGFLQWMAGNENEGKKTLKASATGYLGVQFIPQIFKIIKAIKIS